VEATKEPTGYRELGRLAILDSALLRHTPEDASPVEGSENLTAEDLEE
jgi:hypothetical protein